MRCIVENSGQEQFGRFQRLVRSAIFQLCISQQIRGCRERVGRSLWHRKWAGRFDDQQIAAARTAG